MGLYLFVQELFLTAFVALLFSFLLVKFFYVDHVKLSQKGDQETVNFNKVLKVGGTKSKRKRVRLAVDEVVEKVDCFSGVKGLVGFVSDECQVFDEMAESEVGCDDFGGKGSGKIVRGVEVLGDEMEGGNFDSCMGESSFIEKDEKCMRLFSDDESELVEMVVEERSEGNANERNLGNQDLSEMNVEKKDIRYVGLAGDDGVCIRSGEFEVWKESVIVERGEGNFKGGDVVSAEFDEKSNIEEAENEKMVDLGNDDVLGDHAGEVRVLKDLVSVESDVSRVVKEEIVVNYVVDRVVTNETVENEMVGDGTRVILASGGVVIDQSGEVRVLEVSQGTGIDEKVDKGNNEGEGLVSDEDDDWEGIERSDLEKVFDAAANYVDNGGKVDKLLNLGNDEQMQFYALHKVAMEGPCYEAQPMALKISARAKWNAWQRLGNMSPEVAMEQYVSLLSDKDPSWMEGQISVLGNPDSLQFPNPGTPDPVNKQIQYDILLDLLT